MYINTIIIICASQFCVKVYIWGVLFPGFGDDDSGYVKEISKMFSFP